MKETVQPIVPSEGGDVGRPCAGGFAMTESVCKQSFLVAQLTLHLQKSTERLVSLAGEGIAWASHDGFVAALIVAMNDVEAVGSALHVAPKRTGARPVVPASHDGPEYLPR